jgi:ubiquinone/menaquinone biosynthesis C-methylase UbiE
LKSESGYQPKAGDTVVEIGCGVGWLTRAIAPEVGEVLAFDLSAEMLTIARSSVEAANASFHRAETPALAEIWDSTVDAFVAYCVFSICLIWRCCVRICGRRRECSNLTDGLSSQ